MGNDANIHINKKNFSKSDVYELLKILGYKRQKGGYRFYIDDNYKYYCPVNIWKAEETKNEYIYSIRTQIWANGYDIQKMNHTLRCFKKYCKAWFDTDEGKNRYFKEGNLIEKAEAGCYYAVDKLFNHFSELENYSKRYPEDDISLKHLTKMGLITPNSLNANVYVTYLCSIIEEYFRSTYIALLKYSNKKEKIMNSKLSPYDLSAISNGSESIEEAYAKILSFQNISKICSSFHSLNNKIDINGVLKKPYRGRKKSLYSTINDILEHRHGIVHRLDFDIKYHSNDLLKDIGDTKVSIIRVYNHICDIYGWEKQIITL